MNMNHDLRYIIDLAKNAGQEILSFKNKKLNISVKEKDGLVTDADLASEKIIIDGIQARFPTDNLYSEESFSEIDHDKITQTRSWAIDPLDGTNNFVNGQPFYSVSIALVEKGKVILAVVFIPECDQLFYASMGEGSYFESKGRVNKITTSLIDKDLKDCLYTTNISMNRCQDEQVVERSSRLFKKSLSGRKLGSATLDICYTALGWYDYCLEVSLYPWDIAAASLICSEAGLKVTNFDHSDFHISTGSIFVRSKQLDNQIKKLINT